jgi:hypothetical protein
MKSKFLLQRTVEFLRTSKTIYRTLSAVSKPDGIRKLNSAQVLLVLHDVDRSLCLNGQAFSPLLDPVRNSLKQMNITTESVAHPFSRLTEKLAFGGPKSINRSFLFYSALEKISRVFGLRFSPKTTLWMRIIRSCEAKVILTIGADKQMCIAADRCHTKVVELLHGYRYSPIPWGYENRDKNELPTYVLALDKESQKTFSTLSTNPEYCRVVQHPMLETAPQNIENWMAEEFGWTEILDLIHTGRRGGKRVILVCLQWGYGPDEMFRGVFPNQLFPEALIDVVDQTHGSCIWIFRLHPVQLIKSTYKSQRQYLAKFIESRPHVFGSEFQNIPVAFLVSHVDCQLSPGSGTTAEALDQGVPSIFLDSSDYVRRDLENGYREELNEGKVQFWNGNTHDLLNWIMTSKKFERDVKQRYPKVSEVIRVLLEGKEI